MRLPPACHRMSFSAAALLAALAAQANTELDKCVQIGPPADRLACYDKAMGRAAEPTVPPAYAENPAGGAPAPASTSLLAPKGEVVAVAAERQERPSLMSKFWELEPEDKRGVFNFVGYRANYVLPLHWTTRINRAPQSPNQAPVELPNYKREEAKFQLSLRTKLAQDLLLPGGDLWAAFTQQAMWQIWNGKDSKPFRNSDYEPELMYVVPVPEGWRQLPLGWQWRYAQVGIAHQSNGQSDPLSRSWNRVNMATGFERGDWSVVAKFLRRLKENADTDNNPDLVGYRGRGEFQVNWAHEKHTAQLLYRTTLKDAKYGALQFEWTYPVFKDQPNGLRWYVQLFRGYGETLTDYNFRQTSIGAGFSFLQF
ncbi:phospholipase A [Roseateles asaccharophilus]|uniref:Phospholipase A1 n=1 Tax=Roseateles asaccharophilus TaxID=582607 RepID=A0ABU2A3Q5_9BURK|nr:phospholipase A [Roseateles asaccharophilus]MDR7331821.1 phospholipase A1 [Roseateles asaccharophilus]